MKIGHIVALATFAAALASPASAQDSTHGQAVRAVARSNAGKGNQGKDNLRAEAKISRDSARAIALAKVATGSKVRKSSLTRQNGTVVYVVDLRVPGTPGVEKIVVSAIDGSVISQTHEAPKQVVKAEGKKGERKKSDKK